jgi:hypothetical protein
MELPQRFDRFRDLIVLKNLKNMGDGKQKPSA